MTFNGITLVTGAAGFMGSHLVERLVKRGVRVRATARPRKNTSFFDKLGVEFVPADLTEPEGLPALFEGGVDRVFHLGAVCNFSTPYERLHPTNVNGVARITYTWQEVFDKTMADIQEARDAMGLLMKKKFIKAPPLKLLRDAVKKAVKAVK